jgi:hypothetical protein
MGNPLTTPFLQIVSLTIFNNIVSSLSSLTMIYFPNLLLYLNPIFKVKVFHLFSTKFIK